MAKSIRDVLAEFREHSLDERDKGARFEQLMKDFLQNDTQYQRLFDEVWLWSDYPDRGNRPDTGIDLVARERDTGELVAIQCKFYAPDALISKPDIDSFLASSSKAEFKGRMFISTSDNWGKNAEEAIAGQKPEVARLGLTDLDESSIDWSKFSFQSPQNLEKKPRKTPRPHQEEAIQNVLAGFEEAERGKLIMACGTGKTFTSLKLVERMFPNGGTVLFLVPSISLLSQALKEWTIESEASLRSYAVCSDVSVGKRKNDEDLPVTDLAFPATTNTERLVEKFTDAGPNQNGLTVIFSTYQSIDVVAQAQSRGITEFDLIVCDEAHRTTGVTLSGDDESAFVKVHNQGFIKGKKRLYMTATPKVFSDASSKKAEDAGAVLADMGKPEMFGEEFHRLGFGEAVERGILTDYKVLVLAVDEAYVARRFQRQFADDDNELKLEDAAKIVGCWNGLSKRSTEQEEFQIDPGSMRRAVAFARSIAESKKIASMFQAVVDEETAQLDDDEAEYLRCEVEHVDGSFNSLRRNEKLDWLRQEVPDNTARILSNARCLTEGVDVPALDAVMFLNPRDSQVDVVQAVGRVMRKLDGKKYGYVILPIGVPADMDPATALNDNKKYKVVWQVLQALRSHDERFDAMVNKIDLTKKAPQIGIIGVSGGADGSGKDENGSVTLDFPNFDQWRDAILAKIVQKVGEKNYWHNWAKDIAVIAERHIVRITELVHSSDSLLGHKFQRFVKGLQDNLNPSVTESDAIEMLAQHLITRPIFDALFEGYNFAQNNPVSLAMQEMIDELENNQLSTEAENLERFYQSVTSRVSGIEDSASRRAIVQQLYEEFFRSAFPNASDRLGIVYTRGEVVDFMLRSVDFLLRKHFGAGIGGAGVHVLDPFTGTGTFITRLLQSGLIDAGDLQRKFDSELHANEILLLAYYVAAVNIEEVFHALSGGNYRPFKGIVLTDTFQMHEKDDRLDGLGVFPDNNIRVQHQKSLDIRVIVGNPPYSKGQDSINDENPNLSYPTLDSRIAETYVENSSGTNLNSLYDSYIRAFRWASDRIGDQGIVCFVTNGGFIEGNTASGFRKVVETEFDNVYVLNLRGNSRIGGETAKREGGNVFPVRVSIAITFLVRTKQFKGKGEIHYSDIGERLSGEEKIKKLVEAASVKGLSWSKVEPNPHGDWINQRSLDFDSHPSIVQSTETSPSQLPSYFHEASAGLKTNRDAWVYNFSREKLTANVSSMVDFFNSQVLEKKQHELQGKPWNRDVDPSKFSWNRADLGRLEKARQLEFDASRIFSSTYRPFVRQWVYFSREVNDMVYRLPRYFAEADSDTGFGIVIPAPGNSAPPFMALMVRGIPDDGLGAIGAVKYFPRYLSKKSVTDSSMLDFGNEELGQVDNVTDEILTFYKERIDNNVSKDDVFYYSYGVLNSPQFVERFKQDLRKSVARIPVSPNFWQFAEAGRNLSSLHLGYENLEPFELQFEGPKDLERVESLSYLRLGGKTDKTGLLVNKRWKLSGIPIEAQKYILGTRSALDWAVDRYQPKLDKKSGIVNDPNDLFSSYSAGQQILTHIAKLVTMSLSTVEIIHGLPELDV